MRGRDAHKSITLLSQPKSNPALPPTFLRAAPPGSLLADSFPTLGGTQRGQPLTRDNSSKAEPKGVSKAEPKGVSKAEPKGVSKAEPKGVSP